MWAESLKKQYFEGKNFTCLAPFLPYLIPIDRRKLNFAVMDHLISAEDEHQFF